MKINNFSQLNNLNIYKPQNGQKTSNLSFKADSVEFSNKEKNSKKKIPVWSLFLAYFLGCIVAIILGHISPKPSILYL